MLDEVTTLTVLELQELVKHGNVIVYITAEWCQPCKIMTPVLEKLAESLGITVIKVNADNNYPITEYYGVLNLPTLLLFKDGVYKSRSIGSKTEFAMRSFLWESKIS
jgi:thioredoxin 1